MTQPGYVVAVFSRYGSLLYCETIQDLLQARIYAVKSCDVTPGRVAMIVPLNEPDSDHIRYRHLIPTTS